MMRNLFLTLLTTTMVLGFANTAFAFDLATTQFQVMASDSSKSKTYDLGDLRKVELVPPTAEEINPDAVGKQQYLKKGDLANFDGIQLDPQAVIIILSEFLYEREQAALALDLQRKSDLATVQLETDRLRVQMESIKNKSDIELRAKDGELSRLKTINQDLRDDKGSFWRDILLVGGGVVVGVLGGVIIGVGL